MLASVWSDARDCYQPPITQTNSDDKQRPAARPPQSLFALSVSVFGPSVVGASYFYSSLFLVIAQSVSGRKLVSGPGDPLTVNQAQRSSAVTLGKTKGSLHCSA
jgi:hypothetical protein